MVVRIVNGDALAVLRTLESESVQCVVTSPPYFALRDYGVDGQLGLERTPAAFIAALVAVFDEVRRVMRKDATLWVNLGDSYAGSGKGPSNSLQRPASCLNDRQLVNGAAPKAWIPVGEGLKPKDLMLIPERFAIAMQDAGWYVRSRIAWCKTSAMPESVRDRPTSAWEHIWMFSKSARYFYDAEAVRQPLAPTNAQRTTTHYDTAARYGAANGGNTGLDALAARMRSGDHAGANLRNFWLLGPEPSREAHYAAFVTAIPKRCILAGTSQVGQCRACGSPWARVVEREGTYQARKELGYGGACNFTPTAHNATHAPGTKHGLDSRTRTTGWSPSCSCVDAGPPVPQTVLDPFLGSGTTALVADRLGRDAIGIELSPTYCQMAREKIESDEQMFSEPVQVVEQAEQLSMLGAL